jgi:hypothetical protein
MNRQEIENNKISEFDDYMKYECHSLSMLVTDQIKYIEDYKKSNKEFIDKYDLYFEHTVIKKMEKDGISKSDIDDYLSYRKCVEHPSTYNFFITFKEDMNYYDQDYDIYNRVELWNIDLNEDFPDSISMNIDYLKKSDHPRAKELLDKILLKLSEDDLNFIEDFSYKNDTPKEYLISMYNNGKNKYIKRFGNPENQFINEIIDNINKSSSDNEENDYLLYNMKNPHFVIMELLSTYNV